MKVFKRSSIFLVLISLTLSLYNCEKIDSEMDLLADPGSEVAPPQLKAVQNNAIAEISYLLSIIEDLESMADGGIIKMGNANALISKITHAIKSIEKGNVSNKKPKKGASATMAGAPDDKPSKRAAKGLLKAFINQVDALLQSGNIPLEEGQFLIGKAENAVIIVDGSFTDLRDDQVYAVVLIGDQLWMAENLRATKYNDGNDIPLVTDNASWRALTTAAYCWYDNDPDIVYGALYNWYSVNTAKLSPTGWHVPSDAEWKQLEIYLGMSPEEADMNFQFRGTDVGGKLKGTGTEYWNSPNTGATNESGFTALPGGLRNWVDGEYYNSGSTPWASAFFWTSTAVDNGNTIAYHRHLVSSLSSVFRGESATRSGYSIRCVKDLP